jgi:DNA helicase-2/ATP-dependent DNA helicase PcrA
MKERVYKLLKGSSIHIPWMGTFHSVCAKILRREIVNLGEGFTPNFTIFDEDDSLSLIKKIMGNLHFDTKRFAPQMVKAIISKAKNELIDEGKFIRIYGRDTFTRIVANVYKEYERELRATNALDFDNLINKTVALFRLKRKPINDLGRYETILEKYQEIFRYILVDEYQDTNHAQYFLLKILAARHKNIAVVGDDWQSIYRFRGADFRNILEFKRDYSKTKIIKLEQNYRSTGNIIDAAQSAIEKNAMRSKKKLFTQNEKGEKVKVIEVANHEEEGELAIKEIKLLNQAQKNIYNNSVILYRTNAQSRALEETMIRYNIPYRIIGGVRFYKRKEIKDILAYLKIIDNPKDTVSARRIINTPSRGISKTTLARLGDDLLIKLISNSINKKDIGLPLSPRTINALVNFSALVNELREASRKKNITLSIPYLLEKTLYKDYLLDGTEEGVMRFENTKELLSVAQNYSALAPDVSLRSFLEEVTLISEVDNYDAKTDALTLMTIHNAKGLEFDHVFIVGLEEGIFPHSRSMSDPEEIEEERRLFYVGMTRARKNLFLVSARERLFWGGVQSNTRSRFIGEVDPQFIELCDIGEENDRIQIIEENGSVDSQVRDIELNIGDFIEHTHFGRGQVTVINDDEITVDFPKLGQKVLSIMYAPIKKA